MQTSVRKTARLKESADLAHTPSDQPEVLLPVKEVARRLGVSTDFVNHSLIYKGKLRFVMLSKRLRRVSEKTLRRFIDARGNGQ